MNGGPAQNHCHQKPLLADVFTFLSCPLLGPHGASVLLLFFFVHFFTDLETAQDPRSVSGKFNLHNFSFTSSVSKTMGPNEKCESRNAGQDEIGQRIML